MSPGNEEWLGNTVSVLQLTLPPWLPQSSWDLLPSSYSFFPLALAHFHLPEKAFLGMLSESVQLGLPEYFLIIILASLTVHLD